MFLLNKSWPGSFHAKSVVQRGPTGGPVSSGLEQRDDDLDRSPTQHFVVVIHPLLLKIYVELRGYVPDDFTKFVLVSRSMEKQMSFFAPINSSGSLHGVSDSPPPNGAALTRRLAQHTEPVGFAERRPLNIPAAQRLKARSKGNQENPQLSSRSLLGSQKLIFFDDPHIDVGFWGSQPP